MSGYCIKIKSGSIWDTYGTDENVQLIIRGKNGETGYFLVQGNKEKGSTDETVVKKKDVGRITA